MSWYALATLEHADGPAALVLPDGAVPLADLPDAGDIARLSVTDIIRRWDGLEARIDQLAVAADNGARQGIVALARNPRTAVPFQPFRIFGAASNYIEHAAEMETKLAAKVDSTPFVFMKSQSSIIGPDEPVVLPPESQKVDWEVELGVVIGKAGRRIPEVRALDHVAGYVVVNDISARDLTRRTDFPFSHDWFRGKSFDSFTPVGPWFVPKSCVPDLHRLRLTLSVNGEMMQDGTSADMIFNAFEQIAYLSRLLELRPTDLLATGTPAGVGMARGIFLKPGDQMVAGIEHVGTIANPVIAEG